MFNWIALRWHLRRCVLLLGWQGLAGLVLAAAAVAVYFAGISPDRARIALIQQEAGSVRQFARSGADATAAAPQKQEAWLRDFYRLLPARGSAPDWLRVIFSAARTRSVALEQGEYRITADRGGRLVSYEIGLPVRGSYVQIRGFVADVLEQSPAAALDEIVIKRSAIGDARIDASLRFTLFLHAG